MLFHFLKSGGDGGCSWQCLCVLGCVWVWVTREKFCIFHVIPQFTLHIESLVCIILALLNFDVLNLFNLFRSCSHAFGFKEYFFASRGGRQLESV